MAPPAILQGATPPPLWPLVLLPRASGAARNRAAGTAKAPALAGSRAAAVDNNGATAPWGPGSATTHGLSRAAFLLQAAGGSRATTPAAGPLTVTRAGTTKATRVPVRRPTSLPLPQLRPLQCGFSPASSPP